MTVPKVSIALPVYNGERHLAAAVDSILAQTYEDFELMLLDNASTDRTEEICRSYAARDPRVRYHRNLENIGAAPNFNRAFELTSSPYFKWAAHDDILEPDFLRECVAVLDARPDVVLCFSRVDVIDDAGAVIDTYDPEIGGAAAPDQAIRFETLVLVDHWCLEVFGVIRRKALARTPLIASYIASDRNLLAELGLLGRFHEVPRVLFHSRDHPGRSVRAIKVRERAAWFDPRLRGRLMLPYWRNLLEYERSLFRVPVPLPVRLQSQVMLLRWMAENQQRLRFDLMHAARVLWDRARGGGANG